MFGPPLLQLFLGNFSLGYIDQNTLIMSFVPYLIANDRCLVLDPAYLSVSSYNSVILRIFFEISLCQVTHLFVNALLITLVDNIAKCFFSR